MSRVTGGLSCRWSYLIRSRAIIVVFRWRRLMTFGDALGRMATSGRWCNADTDPTRPPRS